MSNSIRFVVVVPHYWGKGRSIEEALDAMPAGSGSYPRVVYAYDFDKVYNVHCDEVSGALRWSYRSDEPIPGHDPVEILREDSKPLSDTEAYVVEECLEPHTLPYLERFAGDEIVEDLMYRGYLEKRADGRIQAVQA
jgi:hypothetical protein